MSVVGLSTWMSDREAHGYHFSIFELLEDKFMVATDLQLFIHSLCDICCLDCQGKYAGYFRSFNQSFQSLHLLSSLLFYLIASI